MNINTVNSHNINKLQNLSAMESGLNVDKQTVENKGNNTNELQGSISLTGQVTSYITSLPEAQQQEIKGYLQSTQEAKANGTFNIETSINNAPDAFNDLVNKFNLSDEDKLNIISKGITESNVSLPAQSNLPGASVYADIAKNTAADSSIFDKFISLFSSDSKE